MRAEMNDALKYKKQNNLILLVCVFKIRRKKSSDRTFMGTFV